jgi:hypothetical protein
MPGPTRARVLGGAWGWCPGDLDQDVHPVGVDQVAAAGRLWASAAPAEHGSLLGVAAQHQTGGAELADPLEQRLERSPGDAAHRPGEDQVEADLAAVAEQVGQGRKGTTRRAERQVVVVDQQHLVGTGPPVAGGTPAACRRGRGQALRQQRAEPPDHAGGHARVAGVAGGTRTVRQVDQRAAVVDQRELDLVGRVTLGQAPGQQAQQAGLAAAAVAEDQEVRPAAEQVEPERCQALLVERERHPWRLARRRAWQLVRAHHRGQQPQRRSRPTGDRQGGQRRHRVRGLPRHVLDGPQGHRLLRHSCSTAFAGRGTQAGGCGHPWQGSLELQAGGGEAAAGQGRQRGGGRPADLGLDRVVEAQLEAAADVVAHGQAQVSPAVCGHHQMHAVVQAAGDQLADPGLEVLAQPAQQCPVVDQQEDLAVAGQGPPASSAPVPGGDAVEAVAAELGLALGHHRSQLTHQAPGAVGLTRGAHRPHVGQAAELVEQAAAEVDGVDLHVLWPVGEGEAGDQGAEQGALAASRSPDRGQVPGRTGEVQQQRLLCLRERLVEHADWNLQPAHPTRLRRAPVTRHDHGPARPRPTGRYSPARLGRPPPAETGAPGPVVVGGRPYEHLVQRDRGRQRREPDLVHGPSRTRALRGQGGHRHLHVAAGTGRRAGGVQVVGDQDRPGRKAGTAPQDRRRGRASPLGRDHRGRRAGGCAVAVWAGRETRRGRRCVLGGGAERVEGDDRGRARLQVARKGAHQGRPEAVVDGAVDLEPAEAGRGREPVGVGRSEHGQRLGGAEGAQADAVAEVAVEAADAALVEPL